MDRHLTGVDKPGRAEQGERRRVVGANHHTDRRQPTTAVTRLHLGEEPATHPPPPQFGAHRHSEKLGWDGARRLPRRTGASPPPAAAPAAAPAGAARPARRVDHDAAGRTGRRRRCRRWRRQTRPGRLGPRPRAHRPRAIRSAPGKGGARTRPRASEGTRSQSRRGGRQRRRHHRASPPESGGGAPWRGRREQPSQSLAPPRPAIRVEHDLDHPSLVEFGLAP